MIQDPDNLTVLRRAFHQAPELGFRETQTKDRVAAVLGDIGLEVHRRTGVIGILRAGNVTRAISLRADMDALPITKQSTHDDPSKTAGIMHACGHDGQMAMLLGAAGADFRTALVRARPPKNRLI